MRFCPFCAQENTDAAAECAHCGRRLPVLTPPTVKPILPAAAPPRPAPVRAFPRSRQLTPAVALPVSALSGAALPVSGRSASPAQVKPAAPVGEVEGSTRVESSPFDGPTTQQPRLEPLTEVETPPSPGPAVRLAGAAGATATAEVSETTATAVRLPPVSAAQASAVDDEDEQTSVGSESTQVDDSPLGLPAQPSAPRPVPSRLPAAQLPPLGLPAQPSAPRPVAGAPRAASSSSSGVPQLPAQAPPVPLPPPPGGTPTGLRADPPEGGILPAPSRRPPGPNTLELAGPVGPSPAMVSAAAADPLEPMPATPPPGLLPSVKYLLPLARAIWARHQAQGKLRAALHDDQRLIDDSLHRLGEAAWRLSSRPAELRPELDRADEDDARRRGADKEVARLDMSLGTERERWSGDEHQRRGDLAAREAVVARLIEDLAERRRAQRTEQKALRDIEGRLRAAEKAWKAIIAQAAKAETIAPEKGGGANAAANLRSKAEPLQREVDGFRPEYEAQAQRVSALDAPIAALERKLTDERAALVVAKAELETARAAHQEALRALSAERAGNEESRATAEKSVRLRLVSTGTLLSIHRLDPVEHGPIFYPIYERLDELQAIASARDARIGQLESERRGYDRPSLQRGLVVVGGALALSLILLSVLIALLRR